MIVRCSLVSLSRQVGVGMIMWSRHRIVEVRCIIRSVRGVMLMLVFVRMLVHVSVRMAVHHVAMGVQVVMNVLVGMDMFMRVRRNRFVDLGHRVPPYGGVIANPGRMTGVRVGPRPCDGQTPPRGPRKSIAGGSSRQRSGHELGCSRVLYAKSEPSRIAELHL